MIEDIYYRFFQMTHVRTLSIFLAYLARFVFFLRFLLKKAGLRKEEILIDPNDALTILEKTSPDPDAVPDYSMTEPDPTMDLSIIVPVYNHIDVLGTCIDSLVNQKTRFRYELILVDDGSTDGAAAFIERYQSENVHVIHQANGGIAVARNTGISRARGRYFMFADCDDSVKDTLVESLMQKAVSEDCDIVMCGHNLVKRRNGEVLSTLPNVHPGVNFFGYQNGDMIMNYAGLPWAKVYRRELFEQVRFFPGYWYEDTIVHGLLFPQCGVFRYVSAALYDYNFYEGNFTHVQFSRQTKPKAVDRYWLLKAITEQHDRIGLPCSAMFYTMLLKHVSAYYYPTVSGLSEEVVQAMFFAGRELLLRYKPQENVRLPYMLRLTEKAVLDQNIALWKLCSVNQ